MIKLINSSSTTSNKPRRKKRKLIQVSKKFPSSSKKASNQKTPLVLRYAKRLATVFLSTRLQKCLIKKVSIYLSRFVTITSTTSLEFLSSP
jgi:hypothetical protein